MTSVFTLMRHSKVIIVWHCTKSNIPCVNRKCASTYSETVHLSNICYKSKTNKYIFKICKCSVQILSLTSINSHKSASVTLNVQGELGTHDEVIKWNHFPRYWPFARGIHRSQVLLAICAGNSPVTGVTGHLRGEFTGHRWSPHTKASDAELWCFLWTAP